MIILLALLLFLNERHNIALIRVKLLFFKILKFIVSSFDDKFKYWKYDKNGGIDLSIDKTSIQKLANKVENIHQGARPIYLSVLPEFQAEAVCSVQDFDSKS